MRRTIHALAASILGMLSLLHLVYAAEVPQFRIHAHPDRQTVASGAEAIVFVDQTNVGKNDAKLAQENGGAKRAELDYVVRIRDENGQEPSLTPEGKIEFHPEFGQFGGVQVNVMRPDQTWSESLTLNSLYVPKPKTTYHVSLSINIQATCFLRLRGRIGSPSL